MTALMTYGRILLYPGEVLRLYRNLPLLEKARKEAKRAVDGLNGRTWDAAEHFKAEAQIEALEQTHNAEVRGAAPHEKETTR